jgi:hypothetical protein
MDVKLHLFSKVAMFSDRNWLGAFMTSEKVSCAADCPYIFAAVLLSAQQRIADCAS